MVSNDPIKDYMRRHACGFPEALEALAAQLSPPTAHDIIRFPHRGCDQSNLLESGFKID